MSIRYKLVLGFSVVLVLAAFVALYGIRAIADAGNLVVRLYDQSFMATSSARAAQVRFNEARIAIERALSSAEPGGKSSMDAFAAATKDMVEELAVVSQRMGTGAHPLDVVKKAQALAREWSQSG